MIKFNGPFWGISLFGIVSVLIFGGVSEAAVASNPSEGNYNVLAEEYYGELYRDDSWSKEKIGSEVNLKIKKWRGTERSFDGWLGNAVRLFDRTKKTTNKFVHPCVAVKAGALTAKLSGDFGGDVDLRSGRVKEVTFKTRVAFFRYDSRKKTKNCFWSNED